MNCDIDNYQISDLNSISEFIMALQEYELQSNPELKSGVEMVEAYLQFMLANVEQNQGTILIARKNGISAGFACAWIAIDDDISLQEESRTHAYISDLFVAENFRRQGIAQSLLEAVELEMKLKNCKRIRICSKASNQPALKCYENTGYSAYEVVFSKPL